MEVIYTLNLHFGRLMDSNVYFGITFSFCFYEQFMFFSFVLIMRPGDDVPGCDAMARTSDQGPPSTARRPGSGPGAAPVAASGQASLRLRLRVSQPAAPSSGCLHSASDLEK